MPAKKSLTAVLLAACAALSVNAYDVRVAALTPITPTYLGASVSFKPGGRVGNTRSDGTSVMDAAFFAPPVANKHNTDIFTIDASNHMTRISDNSSWALGDPSQGYQLPSYGAITPAVYVGNPWFCPTSDVASNAYMLFQAQENTSILTSAAANPGAGYDNNVWIYKPNGKLIWRLTDYLPTSNATGSVLGGGVLGPQCSVTDSDSHATIPTLHIVYAHIIQGPPPASQSWTGSGLDCGNGPSDGTCWWFGNWEIVYADINLDASGTPQPVTGCSSPNYCPEPYLTNILHVNPRDEAAIPFAFVTGAGTLNVTAKTLTVSTSTGTLPSSPSAPNYPGVSITTSTGTFFTTVQSISSGSPAVLSLQGVQAGAASTVISFTLRNFVVYEPHWYIASQGDLYLTATRYSLTHSGVSLLWNQTTSHFQELTTGAPAPTTGPNPPYSSTWWNEFANPDPFLTHFIFMSDRATATAHYAIAPEWSDFYMCSGLNCNTVSRLTYYNDTGADSTFCTGCNPITATRGAWDPTGTKYLTLVEYTHVPASQLVQLSLRFPNTEMSGGVKIKNAQIGIRH